MEMVFVNPIGRIGAELLKFLAEILFLRKLKNSGAVNLLISAEHLYKRIRI